MELNVPVKAYLPEQITGIYDIVFLLTKQTTTESALKQLLPHLGPDSVVCTLQNGIPESLVAPIVGKERTMGGSVAWGATWLKPGVSLAHLESRGDEGLRVRNRRDRWRHSPARRGGEELSGVHRPHRHQPQHDGHPLHQGADQRHVQRHVGGAQLHLRRRPRESQGDDRPGLHRGRMRPGGERQGRAAGADARRGPGKPQARQTGRHPLENGAVPQVLGPRTSN